MEVEIGKMASEATPASSMSEYVVEHVVALMTIGGIESISAVRYSSGFGSRLHVSIAPFADVPKEVADQGVIIKDALAQILSIANINRIVLKPDEKDRSKIRESWSESVKDARFSNMGSGQDFSSGASHEAGEPA